MKAYQVSNEWGEGEAVVVFAKHAVVARREGANELNREFGEVSCRRAPLFDPYANQGWVPVKALLEAGWWYTCSGRRCYKRVIDPEAIMEGEAVFCSEACQNSWKENADVCETPRLQQ